jgi:hypothetical protein
MYGSWYIQFQHFGAHGSVTATLQAARRNINLNKSEAAATHVKTRVRIQHWVYWISGVILTGSVVKYQGLWVEHLVHIQEVPATKILPGDWLTSQNFWGYSHWQCRKLPRFVSRTPGSYPRGTGYKNSARRLANLTEFLGLFSLAVS